MIAFAAKAGSTASDGDSRNSPFAAALVEHLPKPGLDLRRAFGFVRDDVSPDVMLAHIWGAFVGVVKAARLGYLPLDDARLAQARDASWRAFASTDPPKRRR